jgi:hypothetical protein
LIHIWYKWAVTDMMVLKLRILHYFLLKWILCVLDENNRLHVSFRRPSSFILLPA